MHHTPRSRCPDASGRLPLTSTTQAVQARMPFWGSTCRRQVGGGWQIAALQATNISRVGQNGTGPGQALRRALHTITAAAVGMCRAPPAHLPPPPTARTAWSSSPHPMPATPCYAGMDMLLQPVQLAATHLLLSKQRVEHGALPRARVAHHVNHHGAQLAAPGVDNTGQSRQLGPSRLSGKPGATVR